MADGGQHRRLALDSFLPYQLSVTSNAVSRLVARAYGAHFGLSIPEWRIMAALHDLGEASQQDLVARTLMDKVAVSRAAQGLEARALITRQPDPGDRRAWRLALSHEGQAMFARIEPLALSVEDRLLAGLDDGQVTQLAALLDRLRAAATLEGDA